VNRFERETITAKALGEKPAQLNVIFDDKKSLHFLDQLRRYQRIATLTFRAFTKLYVAEPIFIAQAAVDGRIRL